MIYQQPQQQARMKRTISVSVPGQYCSRSQHLIVRSFHHHGTYRSSPICSVTGRVNSPRTPQGQFLGTGQENIMSPQPQMSPSYPQSAPSTPVTQTQPSFNVTAPPTPTSASTPSNAPPPYSGTSAGRPPQPSDGVQFSFDQQNLQIFSGSGSSNSTTQQSSER